MELLLQVFDREGLTLIPAIEFVTPIPELEELRRAGDSQSTGIELVGPDGQTWLQSVGTRSGSAPYYNILNPRVQQAMLGVVREIVERYGAHPAFGGLAVQLNGNGFSQLSLPEWGLDDATIGRFTHDTGTPIPESGKNRFADRHAALAGQYIDAWRTWRAAQVADFYSRVASIVDEKGQRKLILTTEKLFDHPTLRQKIRPNLLAGDRIGDALMDVGIDRQRLERTPGILLCPTYNVEPTEPLPDRAADLEVNAAFSRWGSQLNSSAQRGMLLYHRPSGVRLSNFGASAPFRIADDMHLTSEPAPSDAAARQPYLRDRARKPGVNSRWRRSFAASRGSTARRAAPGIKAAANGRASERTRETIRRRSYVCIAGTNIDSRDELSALASGGTGHDRWHRTGDARAGYRLGEVGVLARRTPGLERFTSSLRFEGVSFFCEDKSANRSIGQAQ